MTFLMQCFGCKLSLSGNRLCGVWIWWLYFMCKPRHLERMNSHHGWTERGGRMDNIPPPGNQVSQVRQFIVFLSSSKGIQTVSQIMWGPLPSTFFPIYYSIITEQFNAIYFKLLITSVNKQRLNYKNILYLWRKLQCSYCASTNVTHSLGLDCPSWKNYGLYHQR
jgi:hypothetical protein